jgi:hypothetical protein
MDTLSAGTPVIVGDAVMVPVERCRLRTDVGERGGWLSVRKEPFALIVSGRSGTRAFSMEAKEIPLETLLQKIENPEALQDLLPA